jgi:hypothetical protein
MIEFHSGGFYEYFHVEEKRFKGLKRTPSLGKYFHKFIKDKYKFKKVL